MVVGIGCSGALLRRTLWTLLQLEIFVMRMVVLLSSFASNPVSNGNILFFRASLFSFEIKFAKIITAVASRIGLRTRNLAYKPLPNLL